MYSVLLDGVAIHDPKLNDETKILLDGVITKKVNCADNFSFAIYPGNVGYNSFTMMKSVISVYKDGELLFRGRPLTEETGWDNEKKIVCEGDLAIFNDTVLRPYEYDGTVEGYLRFLVNQHNAQTTSDKQVTLRYVTVTDPNDRILRSNSDYVSTMQELQDKVVGNLGGYLCMSYENDMLYLDYLTDSTSGTNQILQIGKNILDFQRSISAEALATALVPLGAKDEETGERLTIKSVNGNKDYITNNEAVSENGLIFAVQTWDDVTVPANLLRKSKAVLSDLTRMIPRIQLTAVDLTDAGYDMDAIGFFEYVTVVDTAHDVSGQYLITERQYNLSAPENDKVTFGGEEESISGQAARNKSEVAAMGESVINTAISIIDYQTDLLKGGAGGYVVIGTDEDGHPNEIYFLDTDSKETARSVLRINMNGIGFSTTGFSGPYTNAWTIDGSLNASFISTGIFKDTATNGQKFYLNLNTGEVRLESLDIVAEKLSSIGTRNLIQNTLYPNASERDTLPRIVGQVYGTTSQSWEVTTAEHGMRLTKGTGVKENSYPLVSFGRRTDASMNGLVAGKTYTLSFDLKALMGTLASGTTGYMRLGLGQFDANNAAIVSPIVQKRYEVTYGELIDEHITWTFTIEETAKRAYFQISWWYSDETSIYNTDFAETDYYELANIKLEEGELATGWSPAPEDLLAYTDGEITATKAEIKVTTDAIESSVTAEKTRAEGAESSLSSRITQNADNIALKVSQTDYNGNTIASLINQTATTIKLSADKIALDGYVTFDNLKTGGRNLIRGTQYMKGTTNWAVGGFYKSGTGTIAWNVALSDSPVPNCSYGVQLTTTAANTQIGFAQGNYPSMQNGPVTQSVWVKGTKGDTIKIQPWWKSSSDTAGNKNFTISATGVWERFSWTSTKNPATVGETVNIGYVYLISPTVGNSCLVCADMLEYGNTPSDWTPAPEDNPTFTDLSTAGQTIIDGGNITTGMIKDAKGNNYWNLATGEFTITNGTIKISTTDESFDVIELNNTKASSRYASNGIVIQNYDSSANPDIKTQIYGAGWWMTDTATDTAVVSFNHFTDHNTQALIQSESAGALLNLIGGTTTQLNVIGGTTTQLNVTGGTTSGIAVTGANDPTLYLTKGSNTSRATLTPDTGLRLYESGTIKHALQKNTTGGQLLLTAGDGSTLKLNGYTGNMNIAMQYNNSVSFTQNPQNGLVFRNASNAVTASYAASCTATTYTASETTGTLTFSTAQILLRRWGSTGYVQLNLNISNPASFATATEYTIYTLPTDNRPAYAVTVMVPNERGTTACLVQVKTSGVISIYRYANSAAWYGWLRCAIPLFFAS